MSSTNSSCGYGYLAFRNTVEQEQEDGYDSAEEEEYYELLKLVGIT